MLAIKRINPVVRATVVIGAVMALVTSTTFALLSNTVTMTGNTIGTTSATAVLGIWDGEAFSETAPGFQFDELVEGEKSDKHHFVFQNNGNTDLYIKASIASLPTLSEGLTPEHVIFKFYGNCDEKVSVTLADLVPGPVTLPCGPLDAGAEGSGDDEVNEDGDYAVKVMISEDAPDSEEGHTVGSFDIVFQGDTEEENMPPVEEPTAPVTQ